MKNFMKLKVKTWELVVVCIILACVIVRPDWLIQLNQSLIGKVLLLVALVAASLHKPYMGLLVLLLIVSLGYYREGLKATCDSIKTKMLCEEEPPKCKWNSTGNGTCETEETEPPSTNTNTPAV